jgi:putative transposase
MPRRARISIPGIPWHIIQRGNNRSACFHAEEDYQFYLHYLEEFATKYGCAIQKINVLIKRARLEFILQTTLLGYLRSGRIALS